MKTAQKPVTAYFEADHDRLDCLFQKFQEKKRGNFALAKPYFREFLKGLRRHIVWEEEVLFPFFEKASGISMGPTEVMRQEHRMIGAILDRIHDKVRKADPNSDSEEQELISILTPHNDKEENILYPAIDQCAGQEGSAQLFLAMEEIPQERFQSCCGSH